MTTIESIFSNSRYQFPILFKTNDLKSEVNAILTAYINDLCANGIDETIIGAIKKFRKSCMYCLSNYLKGIHSNAYDNFEKAIAALRIIESPLLSTNLGNEILYRARINHDDHDFSKDEMFHIPVNNRGIITTQRYSFPGLPCIYAGASAYSCWIELNRPSFDSFQLSVLEYDEQIKNKKIIDLTWCPQRIDYLQKQSWFKEEEYYLYWPLLAICSIKANNDNVNFKPEYIFPQFFLEYILKNKDEYIGIRYVSIKVASICPVQLQEDWHTYVNYVFPTHSDNMKDEKDETLSRLFHVGANRSGKELVILTDLLNNELTQLKIRDITKAVAKNGTEEFQTILKLRNIFTSDGKSYPYLLSVFGLMELAMQRENFNVNTDSPYLIVEYDDNSESIPFDYVKNNV